MVYSDDLKSRLPQSEFIVEVAGTIEEFHEVCSTFGISPKVVFSFNVRGSDKKYALFTMGSPVTSLVMCYAVQGCLKRLFCGKMRMDTFKNELKSEFIAFNDLRNASTAKIIFTGSNTIIDIPYLIEAACFLTNQSASGGNGSKDVGIFSKVIGLEFDGKGCRMDLRNSLRSEYSLNTCEDDIYTLSSGHNLVLIYFSICEYQFLRFFNGEDVTKDLYMFKKAEKDFPRDESNSIDSLIAAGNSCLLLSDLESGNNPINVYQISRIIQAICCLNGAQTTLQRWMNESSIYNEFQSKFIYYLFSRYKRIGYGDLPTPCRFICNRDKRENCISGLDFEPNTVLDLLPQKHCVIRRLKTKQYNNRDASEIREEIQATFNNDLASEENKLYIYKCFVGLGKTRMYLNKINEFIDEKRTVIIALPSHNLKDDVVSRLNESDNQISDHIIVVPRIPHIDEVFSEQLEAYYAMGDYKGATLFMVRYLDEAKQNQLISDENVKELEEYLEISRQITTIEFTSGKIIFTTHERLFVLKHVKPDIVIIDEDITLSILKQQSAKVSELHHILRSDILSQIEEDNIRNLVRTRIKNILEAKQNKICKVDKSIPLKNKVRGEVFSGISKGNNRALFSSKVFDLVFDCEEYIKQETHEEDGNPEVIASFLTRRELPFECKVFVMSATANFEIYSKIFGEDKIATRPFDIPKLAATIEMHSEYTYSKQWFDNHTGQLHDYAGYLTSTIIKSDSLFDDTQDDSKSDQKPAIITFKKYKEIFENEGAQALHFGNVAGIDKYKGNDLVVFGTYSMNPTLYALYTNAIFPEFRVETIPAFEDQLVCNDGYKFHFWTCASNEAFRKIHMWMVESELIQALGRARPVDNACLIQLYGSYPPSEIDIDRFY